MREILAYSTFVFTVVLAARRPQAGASWQIGPAGASSIGVGILFAFGIVQPADITSAAHTLWRPFVTIVSVMLMTASAAGVGLLDRVGAMAFRRAGLSIHQLFLSVFVVSAATASLLNNDAAVLMLTPLVLTLVQRRYPGHAELLPPFAFVVFMAAGVAPFVVSNPMNMIVAFSAGLDFNAYALRMLPISMAGWVIAFLVLRRLFARALARNPQPAGGTGPATRTTAAQRQLLVLLLVVLGSYPFVAMIDSSAVWAVSATGAAVAVLLALRDGVRPAVMLSRGVAWPILVFLMAIFVIAIGLRNVGLVSYFSTLYTDAGIGVIGITAALGSALLNNHPMAIINLLALEATPRAGHQEIMAVLIGGDLGPRLLPIGSLAGLLWLESCRRLGVEISLREFVRVGFAVTVPTLAASLAILALG